MAMHAVVGYQITEEMVRLYCKKKNIGRFHDIGVLLSGRKRSLQAMLDSPRDNENHVLDISSQEDETSAKTSDPQEDVRGMHKSSWAEVSCGQKETRGGKTLHVRADAPQLRAKECVSRAKSMLQFLYRKS